MTAPTRHGNKSTLPRSLKTKHRMQADTSTRNGNATRDLDAACAEFYLEDLFIEVDGIVFKLLRRTFEGNSEQFRTMFTLPAGEKPIEGADPQHPIRLEDVRKDEILPFLRILYPRFYGEVVEMSADQWVGVLRLATLWEFKALRSLALKSLHNLADHVTKICMFEDGRYQLSKERWLLPSIYALAAREEGLTEDEAVRLGIPFVLKLGRAREKYADRGTKVKKGDYEVYLDTIIREVWQLPSRTRPALPVDFEEA